MTDAAVRSEPPREGHRADLHDLDLRSTLELVELMNDADASVAVAVRRASRELAAAIDEIAERLRAGGRLVYAGAGSSGRLALVDAVECEPTFGLEPGVVTALVAGGAHSAAVAQESAEDDPEEGGRDVAAADVGPRDAVVVLSASGRTPYALGAAEAARARGALVVAVVCVPDSPLAERADRAIIVAVGPEVITGSTRLKAGTAQKLVLNTISTATMVRLGRTYGNLMVDVIASNAKLRARARRAVAEAAGVPEADAEAALDACDGAAKVAIVSLLTGEAPDAARARLEAAGGSVRAAAAP